MSRRKAPSIVREGRSEPDAEDHALIALLKPIKKAVHPDGPDSVRRDQGAHTIDQIISK
jgi:hypothetical protein